MSSVSLVDNWDGWDNWDDFEKKVNFFTISCSFVHYTNVNQVSGGWWIDCNEAIADDC